jgi:pimeloyl-ACP methyl ester carboxylesterase
MTQTLTPLARVALALALTSTLAACGGGADVPPAAETTRRPLSANAAATVGPSAGLPALLNNAPPTDDPSPGTLRGVTPLGTVSTHEVAQALIGSRVPAIAPVYDVEAFRLTYMTTDGQGQPIVASGLLAVPKKAPGAPSPVISYQHGTVFRDAEAPSNNPTGTEPAVVMASLGYIVVAADYVGYGASKGAPHPYLLSAPTAASIIDLLYAARAHARLSGVVPNGQLFLVGYSEGGYATAAAHRALQTSGGDIASAVVGSAPGAGPLDVGAVFDELLRRVRSEDQVLAWLLDPDVLQNLGATLRAQVRDELLKRLLPGDADVVFQTTFIDNFLANDRGAINRDSDVYDWRPATPVRLFHGRDDQTVPFMASEHALQAMQARGAPDVQLEECTLVPSGHLQCVTPYWIYMLSQMALVVRDL